MRKFLAYFIPIVVAFAIGALGSYIQGAALEEWYPFLVKSPCIGLSDCVGCALFVDGLVGGHDAREG